MEIDSENFSNNDEKYKINKIIFLDKIFLFHFLLINLLKLLYGFKFKNNNVEKEKDENFSLMETFVVLITKNIFNQIEGSSISIFNIFIRRLKLC